VTTAQNLGIPALLNLEESGVRIDAGAGRLLGRNDMEIREGDWVTISSRYRTLYVGRAVYAPARLLRFMNGEPVEIAPEEIARFKLLAEDYRQYRSILERVDASQFESLQDLGHAIRYGELRDDEGRAAAFVNRCFDQNAQKLVLELLRATLGMHLINRTAFTRLTADRRVLLLRSVAAHCLAHGLSGYEAGAFVVGCLIEPESPPSFWKRFAPDEVAFLINEWVLHQKYLRLLNEVGEKRISRARSFILTRGLATVCISGSEAASFVSLKLSGADLNEVRRRIPEGSDPQTAEIIETLGKAYGVLFDYADASSLEHLRRVCASESIPLPDPDER
jgi:hypothetical protein